MLPLKAADFKTQENLIISELMKEIEAVGDIRMRRDLYVQMLNIQIMHNETELFEETADKLDDEEKDAAVMSVCRKMIDMKKTDAALSIMHLIRGYDQSLFLLEIGENFLKRGAKEDFDRVLKRMIELASQEKEPYYKARILSNTASMYIMKNDNVNAIDYLTKALYTTFPMSDSPYKTYAMADISSGYLRINDRIISTVMLMQLSGGSDFEKFSTLYEIYRQKKLIGTAKTMLDKGFKSVKNEKDAVLRTSRMLILGDGYLKISERKKAYECYKDAAKSAKGITSRSIRVNAMITANTFIGNKSEWDRIMEETSMMASDAEKNRAVIRIARGMMKNGYKDKGFAILHIAEDNVKKLRSEPYAKEMLYMISDIYVDYGDREECSSHIGYLKRYFSQYPEVIAYMYTQNGRYFDASSYASAAQTNFLKVKTMNEIILHALENGKRKDAEALITENCRSIKKMKRGYERTLLSLELYNSAIYSGYDINEHMADIAVIR